MGALKKSIIHQVFSSNTTFSTDVLQHEYIIYIYIFYTYIFQIRSEIRDGMLQTIIFPGCKFDSFPCVSQVLFDFFCGDDG